MICTVAGTGRAQFDGDGRDPLTSSFYFPIDVEFDSARRPLILDWNNFRVRRVNEDNTVETIVGNGFEAAPVEGALAIETSLHHASDLAIDSSGNMYLAGDHAPFVFRVGLDGRVALVAGRGDYGWDGDGGPARDAALGAPFGVALAGDGSLYISDIDYSVIRHVDAQGVISTVAGDGSTGYSGDGGPAVAAQLNGPTRMRLAGDGALYICDSYNHVIRRLSLDGTVTTVVGTGEPGLSGDGGPASAAQLNTPYDILIVQDVMLIADTGNDVVRRVDADGRITTLVGTGIEGFSGDEGDARECQLNGPSSLTMDSNGALWIGDTFNQRVRRVAQVVSLLGAD